MWGKGFLISPAHLQFPHILHVWNCLQQISPHFSTHSSELENQTTNSLHFTNVWNFDKRSFPYISSTHGKNSLRFPHFFHTFSSQKFPHNSAGNWPDSLHQLHICGKFLTFSSHWNLLPRTTCYISSHSLMWGKGFLISPAHLQFPHILHVWNCLQQISPHFSTHSSELENQTTNSLHFTNVWNFDKRSFPYISSTHGKNSLRFPHFFHTFSSQKFPHNSAGNWPDSLHQLRICGKFLTFSSHWNLLPRTTCYISSHSLMWGKGFLISPAHLQFPHILHVWNCLQQISPHFSTHSSELENQTTNSLHFTNVWNFDKRSFPYISSTHGKNSLRFPHFFLTFSSHWNFTVRVSLENCKSHSEKHCRPFFPLKWNM